MMSGYRPFALALTLALAGSAALTAQTERPETIRLATWNLEHFGRRTNPAPRTDAQIADLAAFIRDERRFDVLAVQEVNGASALQKLTAALGADWQFVVGTTGGFREDPGRIAVGFVWNSTRVELLHSGELLDLPREHDGLPIFHRVPVMAAFRARRGEFDFHAVTVHLKAGRGAKNEAKRSAEVHYLRDWLEERLQREGEDPDVVVLGDFNHTYGAPAFKEFTSSGSFSYLEPSERRPTIVHFADPIDHIAVTRQSSGIVRELVKDSHRIHGDAVPDISDEAAKNRWRSTYSDHIPVSIDLYSALDLDPDATIRPVPPSHRLQPGGVAAADRSETGDSPQTTAAAPAPSSSSNRGIRVGDLVTITLGYRDDGNPITISGTLQTPLGAWFYVNSSAGEVVALTAHTVRAVTLVRAAESDNARR